MLQRWTPRFSGRSMWGRSRMKVEVRFTGYAATLLLPFVSWKPLSFRRTFSPRNSVLPQEQGPVMDGVLVPAFWLFASLWEEVTLVLSAAGTRRSHSRFWGWKQGTPATRRRFTDIISSQQQPRNAQTSHCWISRSAYGQTEATARRGTWTPSFTA